MIKINIETEHIQKCFRSQVGYETFLFGQRSDIVTSKFLKISVFFRPYNCGKLVFAKRRLISVTLSIGYVWTRG